MNKLLVTGGTGLVGSTINADVKLSSKDDDIVEMLFLNHKNFLFVNLDKKENSHTSKY